MKKKTLPAPILQPLISVCSSRAKVIWFIITGAEIYDADDDDWAGEIDYQPIRANKYLTLPADATAGLKRAKVQELVIDTLTQLVKNEPGRLLFANRVVTTNFDDGDLTVIKKG